MLFPSLTFLLFFAPVFVLSWLSSRYLTLWKVTLTVASIVFYGWWSFEFLLLLLSSCVANYAFGALIYRAKSCRRQLLWFSVAANLSVLFFFKYYKFAYVNLIDLSPTLELFVPALDLILPVGVSFYTFQGVSYVVDVYRREVPAASLLNVMCYKMFFPQLVAGPIVRAADFIPQLAKPPHLETAEFNHGLGCLVIGLTLKLLIANYLAQAIVDPVFADPLSYDSTFVLAGVYGYAMQIYCDFAGYTLMAIGLAQMLGIRLPQNFRQPYFSCSLQDFWRRWHISLSTWLRDYLYIPLGGNKKGPSRTLVNLLTVMVFGGLWHGAGWNFLIWGLLHGLGLCANVVFKSFGVVVPRIIGWFITFHYVTFAWIFFRAPDFEIARDVMASLLSANWTLRLPLGLCLLILAPLVYDCLQLNASKFLRWWQHRSIYATAALSVIIISGILLIAPPTEAPFIYFQF
jgi:alginate O-acetyltransferase complex protein AlgI